MAERVLLTDMQTGGLGDVVSLGNDRYRLGDREFHINSVTVNGVASAPADERARASYIILALTERVRDLNAVTQ